MIGGRVLDPSALAAHAQGWIGMAARLASVRLVGSVLYLPQPCWDETLTVWRHYPAAAGRLWDLHHHECVVWGPLGEFDAGAVVGLLGEVRMWDVPAAHVALVARDRGWPVLSADPGRVLRVARDVDVDEL